MATRKGKTRPRRPPVNRAITKRAAQVLEAKKPRTSLVTMASINEMRRELRAAPIRNRVVAGRVLNTEFGASGTLNMMGRIYQEDYNPLFDGKNGLAVFDQMDRSDGQVGAAGDICKLPLRAAKIRAVPPESATQKEKDIAESVNSSLFEFGGWPDGEGWDMYFRHILMRVTHGFGLVEKVWTFDEDLGVYRWKRLAPRLPRTVESFIPYPDGSLKAIIQYVAQAGTGRFEHKTIPAEYAFLSVREREGDNYFGKSIYRRLYKHWFYKDEAYRIDGVRLDRYGVGVPVAKIKEGHVLESDELYEIEATLQALRSHDRAYIIEPPLVDFRIMVPEGGHGGATGLMDSVGHHDTMILRGVLATFMSDHQEGLNTNRTRTLADFFLHAEKAEANAIMGDLLSQMVRPYCNFNFDMTDARTPVLEINGLGDLTAEMFAGSLVPLVDAGIVTADDPIEDILRKIFGLPPLLAGYKRGETKPVAPAPGGAPGAPPPENSPEPKEAAPAKLVEADAMPGEPLLQLWTQPRSKTGQFSFGKKGGASAPGTTKQAGGPPVGEFKSGTDGGLSAQAVRTLSNGEVKSEDSVEGSINDVLIVDLETEDGTRVRAIFKSEEGESWTQGEVMRKQYREEFGRDREDESFPVGDDEDFSFDDDAPIRDSITNRNNTYAMREADAYDVDQALGTKVVPPTVWRNLETDKGEQSGMVQAFVQKRDYVSYDDDEFDTDSAYGMAVLDIAIGNTDRHQGNILQDRKGRLVAIDQGLAFPEHNREFRPDATADFLTNTRKPMSAEYSARIKTGLETTDWNTFASKTRMNTSEKESFLGRIDKLKSAFEDYSSPSAGVRETLFDMAKESSVAGRIRDRIRDVDDEDVD
jgi:hypothetical protein